MNDKRSNYFMNIICTLLVVSFGILIPSSVMAESWKPQKELRKFIKSTYPWEDITISNVQVMGAVKENPMKIIVEKGPLGHAVFSLLFKSNKKVMIKAYVRAFDWVVKGKRPYNRGHVLKKDDVYREKMDIRTIPSYAIKDPTTIIGKSLRRPIIANIPIAENMVEYSRVVKRGKRVMLLLHYKGLKITASGMLKEKGYVGSSVRAVNLSSKKEVRGVLIDENTVEVML